MSTPINAETVLNCPMPPNNDAGAATVRGYLGALLAELWREQEGFSGKRPFGNSDWPYDLYGALLAEGLVDGSLDSDGYIDDVDQETADRLIQDAITAIGAA